jgi:hypothetical protein
MEPQALHNAGRLAWGPGPRGKAPDCTGLDVIIVRDGKIAALWVFLDSWPFELGNAHESSRARGRPNKGKLGSVMLHVEHNHHDDDSNRT